MRTCPDSAVEDIQICSEMNRRVQTCIDHHERYHRRCGRLSVCSGYVDNVLISSRESAKKLSSVEYLEFKLSCPSDLFVVRKDRSCLYEIIRLKVIDVGSDLAVIDLDSLLFQNGSSLGRVVIRTSDNESRMLRKPCKAVHRDAADTYEIDS